jgi:hypothetical protein
MADFTGFYFDNVHSSAYGLIRTSDGSRYTEGLIPEFEDREIELVGGDGSLYEGRRFKKTPFTIEVAFDHMTETQLRDLRKWLGTDELKPFRFDERPYKTYWVKPSRKPELTYVCFMEEDEGDFIGHKIRIYKGEGKFEFTAYDPFGYCIDETTRIEGWKYLTGQGGLNWQMRSSYKNLIIDKIDNLEEWGDIAGLYPQEDLEGINQFRTSSITKQGIASWDGEGYNTISGMSAGLRERFISDSYNATVYNPGDFDADFQLLLPLSGSDIETGDNSPLIKIAIRKYIDENKLEPEDAYVFYIKTTGLKEADKIVLDTKKHALIVYSYLGMSTDSQTAKEPIYQKTLRYDLIQSTDFPKIPVGKSKMVVERDLNGFNLRKNNGAPLVYDFIDENGKYLYNHEGFVNKPFTDFHTTWSYEQDEGKTEFNPVYLFDFKNNKLLGRDATVGSNALVELLDTGEHIVKNSFTATVKGGLQSPQIKYNYKYY